MAQGSEPEPGVTLITHPAWPSLVWVRLDEQGIRYRNLDGTEKVGWHQVRCFTAGPPSRDSVALRIVLHDGRVIRPWATRRAPSGVRAAIREAAARHEVPVVPISKGTKQGWPEEAGLYVDPGGKPALRKWTGTQWSPFLQVDPASTGADQDGGPVTVWSPLSAPDQQREWEAAHARFREVRGPVVFWTGVTVVAIAVTVVKSGNELAWGAVASAALCVLVLWGAFFERQRASQAARRAAQLAGAQDNPPAPVAARDDNPPAAITSQSPAADPAAAAVRESCAECGADSTQATEVCARCGAPLLPLASP